MSAPDAFSFLRAWWLHPRRVGAIAPSGSALARLITSRIEPDDAPVLELGAGTGVFTRALLDRGLVDADLTVIEFLPAFATLLQQRFPGVRVLTMDAAHLARVPLYPDARVGAVVSGLPLLALPARSVYGIVAGAFHWLRSDGSYYQFTYGLRCPVPKRLLHRLGLQAECIGRIVRNLPPASVHRIWRQEPVQATACLVSRTGNRRSLARTLS